MFRGKIYATDILKVHYATPGLTELDIINDELREFINGKEYSASLVLNNENLNSHF